MPGLSLLVLLLLLLRGLAYIAIKLQLVACMLSNAAAAACLVLRQALPTERCWLAR